MRPQFDLAIVAPARDGASRLTYVRESVASPICLAVALFAGCLGLGAAGVLGAGLAVLAVLMIAANAVRWQRVRDNLDQHARSRARAKRDLERLKLLRPTGSSRIQHYNELRVLVEEVERIDAAEAARFELQELLDHFVRIAVSHQRCSDALRLAGGDTLPAAPPVTVASRSKRRRDILHRRIRHREQCVQMMERLVDELEGIAELIRLVAQRTACPSFDLDLDREIDRRLWELDELDAALHQLSA
jgi:hypothetical protein